MNEIPLVPRPPAHKEYPSGTGDEHGKSGVEAANESGEPASLGAGDNLRQGKEVCPRSPTVIFPCAFSLFHRRCRMVKTYLMLHMGIGLLGGGVRTASVNGHA